MSVDTYILARTPLSPEEIRRRLLHDPALADLGLKETGARDGVTCMAATLMIRPWDAQDENAALEAGFDTASVSMTLIRGWETGAADAERRVFAAMLRLVPGDLCAELEGGGPLALLRVDDLLYLDPAKIAPESLSESGYAPIQLLLGIPPGLATARIQQPAPHPVSASG